MTESKHQEVLDALNAAMQGKACPMCGGQERTLIDRFSRQDITEIGEPFHSSVGKVVTTTSPACDASRSTIPTIRDPSVREVRPHDVSPFGSVEDSLLAGVKWFAFVAPDTTSERIKEPLVSAALLDGWSATRTKVPISASYLADPKAFPAH